MKALDTVNVVVTASGGECEVAVVLDVPGQDWWNRVLGAERETLADEPQVAPATLFGVVRLWGATPGGGRVGFTQATVPVAHRLRAKAGVTDVTHQYPRVEHAFRRAG